jgi:hypothetical protein
MNDDLHRTYRRWQDADAAGRDEDADAEFGALFQQAAVPAPVTPPFTTRTMAAVAAAGARERRRARRTRAAVLAGGLLAGAAAVYAGAGFGVSVVSTTLTGLLDLLVGAVVTMAGAAETGADLWSVLSSMGRAVAAFVADPAVTVTLFALQGIAVAALFALQRLLGSDEESLR